MASSRSSDWIIHAIAAACKCQRRRENAYHTISIIRSESERQSAVTVIMGQMNSENVLECVCDFSFTEEFSQKIGKVSSIINLLCAVKI